MFEPGVNTLYLNEILVNSSDKILWKDWTLVGVNLSSHSGQSVSILLPTIDCSAGQR